MAKSKKSQRRKKSRLYGRLRFKSKLLIALAVVVAGFGAYWLYQTFAATTNSFDYAAEKQDADNINNARSANGLNPIFWDECLTDIARDWSKHMAAAGAISHRTDSDLKNQVNTHCGSNWSGLGENVGVGQSESDIFNAYMNSAPHKANILDPTYDFVGVGEWYDGTYYWSTQVFADCNGCGGAWTTTVATATDSITHDIPFVGDWDHNGTATPGVLRGNTWYFSNNYSGSTTMTMTFGRAGDIPIVGDFNGDGYDDIGVKRGNTYYIRYNRSGSFTGGNADLTFAFGQTGDKPIVGDWDGDGKDTVGVVRGNMWYLRNTNSGDATITFAYGQSNDIPVAGDWYGQGKDLPGVFRSADWYLRKCLCGGSGDIVFHFGRSTDLPIVGDWNNDKIDSPGIVRSPSWFFSNGFSGTTNMGPVTFGR